MCRNWAMTITAAMTLKWRFLKWARVCERNKCGIVILWFTLWENRWIQNHICPLDIAHWNIYISWILTIFELFHSTSIYRLKLTLNMCFCDLICTDWLSLSFSVWFKSLICHCMLTLCLHLQHIHSLHLQSQSAALLLSLVVLQSIIGIQLIKYIWLFLLVFYRFYMHINWCTTIQLIDFLSSCFETHLNITLFAFVHSMRKPFCYNLLFANCIESIDELRCKSLRLENLNQTPT